MKTLNITEAQAASLAGYLESYIGDLTGLDIGEQPARTVLLTQNEYSGLKPLVEIYVQIS